MSAVAQFLVLAAIDVAGLFAMWFILRSRVRRYLELENLLSGVRDEARALITELNETADRNVSLVEDRMRNLRELLDEADRRMGLVRRELGARAAEREVYAKLNKRRPIVPNEAGESAPAPLPQEVRAAPSTAPLSSAPSASSEIGAALEAPGPSGGAADVAPTIALPEVRLSAERVEPAKTARERAMELYRSGFSAQVIAAKVGATVAEVELMIEMEEMRPASR